MSESAEPPHASPPDPLEPGALRPEDALPQVYEQLRRIAGSYFRGGAATLQPTALVHEAWLRLADSDGFRDQDHFIAVAATAMRQILVDRARRSGAIKRGGDRRREPLHEHAAVAPAPDEPAVDVLELDAALRSMHEHQPRRARVVELRFFAGASIEQAARALGVARSTVAEDWRIARAWLATQLEPADPSGPDAGDGAAAPPDS
ncbi:MAG: ECF-type sigma factor [Phycisphaerales bacterium]